MINAKLPKDSCVVSLVSNSSVDLNSYPSAIMSHTRDVSYFIRTLHRTLSTRSCYEVAIVFNSVGTSVLFAEHLTKRLRSVGVGKITIILMDVALSMAPLLLLLADKVLLPPWAIIGTIDPLLPSATAYKESIILRDLVEQLMASAPKEGVGGKAQVMHALSVSGIYYEYELANKYHNYVEKLVLESLEGKMADDALAQLLDNMLNKIDVHDQPISAREFVKLVPFASLTPKDLESLISLYSNLVQDYMDKEGVAVLVESPDSPQPYVVTISQPNMFRY